MMIHLPFPSSFLTFFLIVSVLLISYQYFLRISPITEAGNVISAAGISIDQDSTPPSPTPSSSSSSPLQDWRYVGTYNQVKTYTKSIPDTKLLAFRGVTVVDVHISHALGPFINITHALEWVSMLKSIESLPIQPDINPTLYQIVKEKERMGKDFYAKDDIMYQTLSFPWPITNRDILLSRQFEFDEETKEITVRYHSIEDDRKPVKKELIRAITPHTMWKFTAAPVPTIQEYERWQATKYLVHYEKEQLSLSSSTSNESSCDVIREKGVTWNESPPFTLQTTKLLMQHVFQSVFEIFPQKLKKLFQSIVKKVLAKKGEIGLPKQQQQLLHHRISATDAIVKEEKLKQQNNHHHHYHNDEHEHLDSVGFYSHSIDALLQNSPVAAQIHSVGKLPYTLIEIETIVDSKGSIPAWFINYMQRFWPSITLTTFRQLAKKGKIPPFDKLAAW